MSRCLMAGFIHFRLVSSNEIYLNEPLSLQLLYTLEKSHLLAKKAMCFAPTIADNVKSRDRNPTPFGKFLIIHKSGVRYWRR